MEMQKIKDTAGKPRLSLALQMRQTLMAITDIREYGLVKYPDAENYKKVPEEMWRDALVRHLVAYIGGEEYDRESGKPHLSHALCNLVYLIELKRYYNDG